LKEIKEFKTTAVPQNTEVLKYLGGKIKSLTIDPNAADIDLVSSFKSLQFLTLKCITYEQATLPVLPKSIKSLGMEGNFDKLNDASFLNNLNPKINLWIDIKTKGMKNIPSSFKNHPDFL